MKKLTLVVLCAVGLSGCVGVKRYNKDVAYNYELGVIMGKLSGSIECSKTILKIQKRHDEEIIDLRAPELNSFDIYTSTNSLKLLHKNRTIR